MKLPQSKEEKNKLLKKIYDYCIKVNWQKTKLDELARELGTTRTELRNLAKRYAKKILDTKAYENLCQQVDEIVDFEKKDTKTKLPILNPILLDKIGKETYLLWETKEEKELVLKYIYDYCIKVKWDKNELEKLAKKLGITVIRLKEHAKKYVKEYLPSEAYELVKQQINEAATSKRELKKLTIPIINPILLEKFGKTTYLLWENEEEKELILKFIYEYCNTCNFSNKSIEQLSKLLGISPYRINKCYQEYTFKYLKLTKEEYHKKRNEYTQKRCSRNVPKTKQTNESLISLEKQKSPKSLWENEEEKESVLKYIYEYCNNLNWDNNELEKLAKKLCITVAEVKRLAKKYIEEYLPRKKYHPLEEQTNETTTSKQLFRERKLSIINPILLQILGKRTYFLWENEEEKELVLKYIYFYCKSFTFYTPKIEQLSSLIGISPRKIKEFCKEYALNYLNLSEEQYKQMLMECIETNKEYTHDIIKSKSKNRNSKSKVIYDALLNTSSLETIIKILDKDDMNKHYILISGISNYVIVHHNGDEQIKEELKRKIKMYTDYVSKQKKEKKRSQKEKDNQEKISIAVTTIQAFIDDKECNSIEYFCKINNISKKDFSKYVDMIAEINFELFSQYDSKVTMMQKERYSELTEKIREIVIYLKIGIKEHEIVRPFDIIDYFLLTQMSFKDISRIAEEIITRNDYNLLKKFINQNTEATNNDPSLIKQVMLEKTIINYQKDKKGQPIPGTEETLSNEEKTKIFNYLKQNKIPTNRKTYNIACRRYINGTLDLNLILSIINPILQKKTGKITYELWKTDEEKELVLKYIYYYCYNFNFSNTSIEQLSNLLGISKSIINECCKEYALKYLQWTETQYNQKRFECSEKLSKQKTPKSK